MVTKDNLAEAERILVEEFGMSENEVKNALTAIGRALFQKDIYEEDEEKDDIEPIKDSENERIFEVGRCVYRVKYYYDILDDGSCEEGYQVSIKEPNKNERLLGFLDLDDVGDLDDNTDDDLFDIITNLC